MECLRLDETDSEDVGPEGTVVSLPACCICITAQFSRSAGLLQVIPERFSCPPSNFPRDLSLRSRRLEAAAESSTKDQWAAPNILRHFKLCVG
jgi:hypothetical protein